VILRGDETDGRRKVTTVDERVEHELDRDYITEVYGLRSGEIFVSDGKKFIFNLFIYCKPMKRLENMGAWEA